MQPVNCELWVIVRTVSPVDHENALPPTSGLIVNERLLRIIGSLKVIVTGAFRATSVSTFLGDVDTMYGLSQNAKNVHGFGTGPGTSGRCALSVALICTRYGVHWEKPSAWFSVRVASPFDHTGSRTTLLGRMDVTREKGSMPSLNCTTIGWAQGTGGLVPLGGSVLWIVG